MIRMPPPCRWRRRLRAAEPLHFRTLLKASGKEPWSAINILEKAIWPPLSGSDHYPDSFEGLPQW